MSGRITKADVESAFRYFCKAAGITVAESYKDHGGYCLNRGPRGYVVYRMDDIKSGVSEPFGARRRPAAEMYSTLIFAADTLSIAKRNEQ